MRISPSFIIAALFLSTAAISWAQTKSDEVIQAWIDKDKAKLPTELRTALVSGRKNSGTPFYENWTVVPSLSELHKAGIPTEVGGDKKSISITLKSIHGFIFEGFSLLIARYGKNDDYPDISELYIKKSSGYKRLLQLSDCNNIRLIKAGSKAPVLILASESGCGSGWGETLYSIGKNGILREVGHLGGWQAGTRYVDIDGDGLMEIINTSSTSVYPDELEKKLKKLKDYEKTEGPVLSENVVYKWDGKEFAWFAEFYDQVEW